MISRVLLILVQFFLLLCVCVCVCTRARARALIYSYTYTCVSCINEPQGITVRDDKNGWFSIDIGRQSTTARIRTIPLFLLLSLALRLYRFIFIPSIFILPRPHPRPVRGYPIRVLSSRNILMLETERFRKMLVPRSLLPPPFSSSSFNTRTSISYD